MKRYPRLPVTTSFLVIVATLAGSLPRLYFATMQYIEYDGWWHVFVAGQDTVANLIWELRSQAHPPLFFLLLRTALLFGHSRLVFRSVSLLAGLATAYLLGRVAVRWSRHWAVPALTALTVSLSWNAVVISCEVRSYMLMALLLVVAMRSLLELVSPRHATAARHSLALCVASALALLTQYAIVIFLLAAGVLFASLMAFRPFARRRALVVVRRRPLAVLAPVAIPLTTAVALFLTHLRWHTEPMNHLPEFYLSTSTAGGPLEFVLRNTTWLVDLFTPIRLKPSTMSGQLLVVLALLVISGLAMLILRPPSRPAMHRVSGSLLILLLSIAVAMGLGDLYPYGGTLRHQFYLFPVAVLFAALSLDAGLARLGSRLLRASVLIVIVVALGAGHLVSARSFVWYRSELFGREIAKLNELKTPGSAVYLDQYSLIAFYGWFHDWAWRYDGVCPTNRSILRYKLSKGDRTFVVFRDRARWSIHDQIERAGADLRWCTRDATPHPVVVFALKQFPERDPHASLLSEEGQAQARKLWGLAGVRVGRLVVDGRLAIVELSVAPEPDAAR